MKKNQPLVNLPNLLKLMALSLCFLLMLTQKSNATHFRSSNITWTKGTNDTVIFNITQGWRWSAYANPAVGSVVSIGTFTFGDATSATLNITVNSINSTEDWFVGSATIKHKYTAVGTSFTAGFSSCCRISVLRDGNNDQAHVANVTVFPYGTNNPPVCLVPPIINLPLNVAATYNLPGFDPEGNSFTYAITPTSQSGLVVASPSGLTLSSAGVINWTPTINGYYAMNITVTDQFGASSNIDFILFVSNTSINPPVFDYSSGQTPVNNQVFTVNPGSTLSFNIKATDIDPGNTVNIFVTGLPPTGPTFSPALPANGNPATTTFTWTPTAANVGAHVLAIQASDNTGGQAVTNVVINVPSVAPPVFDVPPTPVAGTGTCVLVGQTLSQVIQAQNSAAGVNTKISSMSGLPAGATTSPALPTTLAAIATTTLNWSPLAEDWGPNTVTFVATDANLATTNHSFDVLVNSSPVITSPMPSSVATVGTLYTHNFTGTDDNIPYGDFLTYEEVDLPSWLTLNDNGDGTASISGTPSCAEVGTYTFDIILEDYYHHCGPHIEQTITITVSDTQAPTITCLSPIVVSNDAGLCGAYVTFVNPVGSDNCTGATTVQTEGLASGSFFPIGQTTNKFVVTDAAGLKDSCVFTVTVNDTVAPVLSYNPTTTVNSTPLLCGANVNYTLPTLNSICPCVFPNSIFGFTPLGDFNGHRYFRSISPENWTNANLIANALGGHLVTIESAAENTFLTPNGEGWTGMIDSVTEGSFVNVTGSAVSYTNWASGEPNNSGDEDFTQLLSTGLWNDLPRTSMLNYIVEFDCSPVLVSGMASGAFFPIGTTPVTYQYVNAFGIGTSVNMNIVVNDAQAPVFGSSLPDLLYYKFDGSGTTVPNLVSNPPIGAATATIIGVGSQSGSGACGGAYAGAGGSSGSNYVNTGWAPNVSGDWTISFWAKGNFGTSTLSYMFGDGNTGLRCFTNGVAGTNNWILRGNGITDVLVPGGVSTTGSTTTFVYSATSNNIKAYLNGVLVTTVNQGAININSAGPFKVGGYASSTAMVTGTYLDEFRFYNRALTPSEVFALPNACGSSCPNDIVLTTTSGNCSAPASWTPPVASDCSVVTMTSNYNPGDVFPVGSTQVKYIGTDSYNNQDSCSFYVIVTDNEKPTISCPTNIITCNPIVTYAASANDNCGIASINYSIPSGSTFPVGVTNVTAVVTDIHGNKDSCVFQVTINGPTSSSSSESACNTYTWIQNNTTYTQSGSYTQTFTNSVGCDSIHTLHLTINNSSVITSNETIQGCYTWPVNSTTYSVSGTYTANFTDIHGCDSNFVLNLTIAPGVYLSAKAILAGPYNATTGLMNDSLRWKSLIPLTEPYTSSPYNKLPIAETSGETIPSGSLLDIPGVNAIVDWVFVELRSATNPATVIANKRALIQRDGDIVSEDAVSPVYFATVPNGSYYVSIKHRNHLGIMTPSALMFSGCSTTSYNFTTSPVYVNPTLSIAPRKLIGSVYTMWSGDANNNKNVKYNGLSSDKEAVLLTVGAGTPNITVSPVYRKEDLNMDGKVRYNNTDNDRIIIIDNVGTNTQNNIINQHTPN